LASFSHAENSAYYWIRHLPDHNRHLD
jgi:hypothetical protein